MKQKIKTGDTLEDCALVVFKALLTDCGFTVLQGRKQKRGTQYGFDLKIRYANEALDEIHIFIECKDYTSKLNWQELQDKIIQIMGTSYHPDIYLCLSPKEEISNINDLSLNTLQDLATFAIDIITPSSDAEELFSYNEELFEKLYGKKLTSNPNKQKIIGKFKTRINLLLNKKRLLECTRKVIDIKDSSKKPTEPNNFETDLDKKLNEIIDPDDPIRKKYHKFRCDYKVYLEELDGQDDDLRMQIIKWQNNLRIRAERLTKCFQLKDDYTQVDFFIDFFVEAEKALLQFINSHDIDIIETEKLLNGIVFELAAECPLQWCKN